MKKQVVMWGGLIVAVLAVIGVVLATSIKIEKPEEGNVKGSFVTYESVKDVVGIKRNQLTMDDVNRIGEEELVVGDLAAARLVVVEYADYECSACAYYNSYVNTLMQKYGEKVAWVFRPYLLSYHKHAAEAASAAEAAYHQGCWEKYKDLLFDNQKGWSQITDDGKIVKTLDEYFGKACPNGDRKQFHKDMYDENVMLDKLSTTMAYGKVAEITGTPAYFINGVSIEAKNLGATIDEMLGE